MLRPRTIRKTIIASNSTGVENFQKIISPTHSPLIAPASHLINADDVAGGWRLALLDATDFVRGQRQRRPTDGSHFAVQVQGVGRRVAGVLRFELGQGSPPDTGVEHRGIRLGGVYHIVRDEGEFGWKNGKD